MDEATKIIIGVVSGFIIAFLAEPVKIYFQNINELSRLRKALYKELYFNYRLCNNIAKKRGLKTPPTRGNLKAFIDLSTKDIKSQYYKQIIQSELDMFYQIEESTAIHNLYANLEFLERRAKTKWINELANIKNATNEFSQPRGIAFAINEIAKVAQEWCDNYVSFYYLKKLDKKILRKIAGNEDYKEIVSNGKQAHETRSARFSHLSK